MTAGVRAAIDAVLAGATASSVESEVLDLTTQGRSLPDTLKDLAHAAACFANVQGGRLIVGVADDRSGAEALVGCTLDPQLTQRRIYEITDPALIVGVARFRVGEVDLLIVDVPSSPEVHAVAGRSTERIGTTCQPMSTVRIATLVAERRGSGRMPLPRSAQRSPTAAGPRTSTTARSSVSSRRPARSTREWSS